MILLSLVSSVIFPNFLRSSVLTPPATREGTRMYDIVYRISLHLWGKKNLAKHRKVRK